MKNLDWFKKNIFYVIFFLFFLLINNLSSPIFDDWEVSLWFTNTNGNLINNIAFSVYGFWKNMNGRALTNVTMMFFTYFNEIWNILSALIFTFLAYIFNNLIKNRNRKYTMPLTFLLFLSVSPGIRMETYSYISANVTYMFALALVVLFYFLLEKQKTKNKYSSSSIFLFVVFSFIVGSWVENLSIGFVTTLFFLNISYLYKNRSCNKLYALSLIGGLMGLLFLFSSPGMINIRNIHKETGNLLENFKISFPININLILYQNKLIFMILSLSSFLAIKTKAIVLTNKKIKIIYLGVLIASMLLIVQSLCEPYIFPNLNYFSYINKYVFTNKIITTTIWFLYILLFIYPIYNLKQNKAIGLLIYLFILFSIFPLFFISQTGNRIVAVPVILFGLLSILFTSIIKIREVGVSKIIYYVVIISLLFKIGNWLYIYKSIHKIKSVRNIIMQQAMVNQKLNKWDYEKDIIILPKFEDNQVLWNGITKRGEFHFTSFLSYYNLDPRTQLIFE